MEKKLGQSEIYKPKKKPPRKPKYYVLDMFPYPSGCEFACRSSQRLYCYRYRRSHENDAGIQCSSSDGLGCIWSAGRKLRAKNKVHPSVATAENIATFKKQLGLLGFTYDWDRKSIPPIRNIINGHSGFFCNFFKKVWPMNLFAPINWCPSCQTGLANEDLDGGKCERCGSEIERRPMRQWVLKITDYAENYWKVWINYHFGRNISKRCKVIDWQERGALVDFKIKDSGEILKIFTTRPDTLFGATYMVMALSIHL